jgi:hypothetical protein
MSNNASNRRSLYCSQHKTIFFYVLNLIQFIESDPNYNNTIFVTIHNTQRTKYHCANYTCNTRNARAYIAFTYEQSLTN